MATDEGRAWYANYLRTDHWRTVRRAALTRADWRCQVCNSPAPQKKLEVHHRTYERVGQELPSDLFVLCNDCHSLYETNKRLPAPPETQPEPGTAPIQSPENPPKPKETLRDWLSFLFSWYMVLMYLGLVLLAYWNYLILTDQWNWP